MLKIILILVVISSSVAFGNTYPEIITVKDRLRILLWTEGLGKTAIAVKKHRTKPNLPEELERSLRKL